MQRSTRFTLSAGSIALASFVFSLTALNAGQGRRPGAAGRHAAEAARAGGRQLRRRQSRSLCRRVRDDDRRR